MEVANPALPVGTGPCTVPELGGSCQALTGTWGSPCLHPSPTRGDQSVGTCAWQVPACHTWVSAASLLLPRSSLWFCWFGVSSVPRW